MNIPYLVLIPYLLTLM